MKKLLFTGVISTVLLWAGLSFAKQDYWEVDKAHTTVGFSITHMGLSKVHGYFEEYDAKVKADDQTGKLSWVKATAAVKSINTGIEKRDAHLQAADFFNAEKFPTITLETKSIKWDGDRFSGTAKVTILGKTKSIPFTGEQTGLLQTMLGEKKSLRAGYDVSATLNRQDFGLSFNAIAEGVNVVSDEVQLKFEVQTFRLLE